MTPEDYERVPLVDRDGTNTEQEQP